MSVSKDFGIYWAVVIPMTLTLLFFWWLWSGEALKTRHGVANTPLWGPMRRLGFKKYLNVVGWVKGKISRSKMDQEEEEDEGIKEFEALFADTDDAEKPELRVEGTEAA